MTTCPRIEELSTFVKNPPAELTCGGVFHVHGEFNQEKKTARVRFTDHEGRPEGNRWFTKLSDVKSLKDLAEQIRLALFEMDCDLSWFGDAHFRDQTIDCQAANQRNMKTHGDFFICSWQLNEPAWKV